MSFDQTFDQTQNTTVFSLEPALADAAPSDVIVPVHPESASRTKRQARHAYGVAELLRDRDELRGVYAPADLVEEFTRWCA